MQRERKSSGGRKDQVQQPIPKACLSSFKMTDSFFGLPLSSSCACPPTFFWFVGAGELTKTGGLLPSPSPCWPSVDGCSAPWLRGAAQLLYQNDTPFILLILSLFRPFLHRYFYTFFLFGATANAVFCLALISRIGRFLLILSSSSFTDFPFKGTTSASTHGILFLFFISFT